MVRNKCNCTFIYLVITFLTFLNGEIQFAEKIDQFRYPKFSDNGFIEWVLEGNSGNYDQSDISIENLELRIYSGDQSTRSLSRITGDNCIFHSDTEIAKSNDSIIINGSGFELSGFNWAYDLTNEIISVNSNASVRFSQNIDSVFSGEKQKGETKISSDSMRLVIEPTGYLFTFEGNCTLTSSSITLNCELLELELLNNSNRINFSVPTGELSGMKSIKGNGNVQFTSSEQLIQSEKFIILPQENSANFIGNAFIKDKQITLKGDLIDLKQSEIGILSKDNNLSSFSNSFKEDNSQNLEHSITSIESKNISLLKQEGTYEYYFDKDVYFTSELYKINAEWLHLITEEKLNINTAKIYQNIVFTEAKDNVVVKHSDYQISGGILKYKPLENHLMITEDATYISDFAKLKSKHLIIENDELFASSDQDFVEVTLPSTVDFNFEFHEFSDSSNDSVNSKTIVYSNDFKIISYNDSYNCIFDGFVNLKNRDFILNSDDLNMIWEPIISENSNTNEYEINKIIANGSVKIEQKNYFSSANSIEILANDNLFLLIGDAHFKDTNGSIWGEKIEFDRELRQTKVIGSKEGERARIQFDIFGLSEEKLVDSPKE